MRTQNADRNLIAQLNVTELESLFLTTLIDNLFAEPHFSDIDVSDMANYMNQPKATVKGVLGSLVKKGLVFTEDSGTGFDLIYLQDAYFFLHKEWREDEHVGDGRFIPSSFTREPVAPAPAVEIEAGFNYSKEREIKAQMQAHAFRRGLLIPSGAPDKHIPDNRRNTMTNQCPFCEIELTKCTGSTGTCIQCGKNFSTSPKPEIATRPLAIESEVRDFYCPSCDTQVIVGSNLAVHCMSCGKDFITGNKTRKPATRQEAVKTKEGRTL